MAGIQALYFRRLLVPEELIHSVLACRDWCRVLSALLDELEERGWRFSERNIPRLPRRETTTLKFIESLPESFREAELELPTEALSAGV